MVSPRLTQVGAHDVDKLIRRAHATRVARHRRTRHVGAHVLFDHLGHEPVCGTAESGNLLHDFGAALLRLKGALECLDLPTDTPHSHQQAGLIPDGMTHRSARILYRSIVVSTSLGRYRPTKRHCLILSACVDGTGTFAVSAPAIVATARRDWSGMPLWAYDVASPPYAGDRGKPQNWFGRSLDLTLDRDEQLKPLDGSGSRRTYTALRRQHDRAALGFGGGVRR